MIPEIDKTDEGVNDEGLDFANDGIIIIADEPCNKHECKGRMKFDQNEQVWECEACGWQRPLDLVEHMQYVERQGPFASLL